MPEPLHLWRAYVPGWAYLPLSGEGAARFGGRGNPVGTPTIYAALELSTAWAEYNQGFVQHPALIIRLILAGARIADLTDPAARADLKVEAAIHDCAWRAAMDAGQEPETHALQARLASQGWHGVIYPSVMSMGGRCLALWTWNADGVTLDAVTLDAVDPDERLPRSPPSWL